MTSQRREAAIQNPRHVLILVENLPVPFDRRVWQEANALAEAGYSVSVICPTGKGHDLGYEVIDGIHIYRHRLREAVSSAGYVREYASALWHQLRLSLKVRRRQPVDVIQACNPPDLMFLVALVHKWLFGTRFVFDHHDLAPELYLVKYGRKDLAYRAMRFFERLTFRSADASIATNEMFRDIAVERGGMPSDRVSIVKSYPDISRFRRGAPEPSLAVRNGHLIGYVGIMGSQDGIDTLVRAMSVLCRERRRDDLHCVIIGDGPELPRLRALACELDVADAVSFTGYLSGTALIAHLSALDIGVIPDQPNAFNDKLSMNKVFEYMMLGLPFVQFRLTQACREAREAGLPVEHSAQALADGIARLIDNPLERRRMSAFGLRTARKEFRWANEKARYLSAYQALLEPELEAHDQRHNPSPGPAGSPEAVPHVAEAPAGRERAA